jgi:hypothetical protein
MTTYIITFDVQPIGNRVDRVKKKKLDQIIAQFKEYIRFSTSTYIIATEKSFEEMEEIMDDVITDDDKIFIAEITKNCTGSISESEWDWLDEAQK